jgi:hypothetical protein
MIVILLSCTFWGDFNPAVPGELIFQVISAVTALARDRVPGALEYQTPHCADSNRC